MAIYFKNNRVNVDGAWPATLHPATVCMWFKVNTAAKHRMFGSDNLWEVRVTDDWSSVGSFRFTNELFMLGSQPGIISTTVISPGVWYHGVATTIGCPPTGVSKVYLNGVFEASGNVDGVPSGTSLAFGNRYDLSDVTYSMDGWLDDIRIYNRVLSANEILTIYTSYGADDIIEGLLNRWIMIEGGTGSVASGSGSIKDFTGNQNGTPVGSPTYADSILNVRGSLNV